MKNPLVLSFNLCLSPEQYLSFMFPDIYFSYLPCLLIAPPNKLFVLIFLKAFGGNAYRILVGKPEGKRPLGRPKRR
jgi:hypothetical protein